VLVVRRDPWRDGVFWPGAALLVVGVAVVLWCVRDFYVQGRGTLAPWDPPRSLVTTGLYRYTRNPMYVGILIALAGWAVLFTSPFLAGYAAVMAIVFHLRVLMYEERRLRRQFPEDWAAYSATVPRWLPITPQRFW
jgi:protein-S-isoprenylcysteine O-methyltransferase Ste14